MRSEVAAGRFDEALYRLIFRREIALPLLRDRADLSQVIQGAVTAINQRHGNIIRFSDEAFGALLAYSWPGNLQELQGILSMVMSSVEKSVDLKDLPWKIKKSYLS